MQTKSIPAQWLNVVGTPCNNWGYFLAAPRKLKFWLRKFFTHRQLVLSVKVNQSKKDFSRPPYSKVPNSRVYTIIDFWPIFPSSRSYLEHTLKILLHKRAYMFINFGIFFPYNTLIKPYTAIWHLRVPNT